MNVTDKEIKELLNKYKKFCVYGLSPEESKPSHYVPKYMRDYDWKIKGIYPRIHSINGFEIYSSLAEIPKDYRSMVVVFRASDKIPALVDEIIDLGGVEVLWLQLGIQHAEAELRAQAAGIKVVSDRCLIIEHKKYF